MSDSLVQVVRGDTQPQIRIRVKDGSIPMDLRGKNVLIHVRRNPRSGVILSKTALTTEDSAQDGYAFLVWDVGDLDIERGSYQFEIEVTNNMGFRYTVFETFELEVRDDFA